MYFPNNTDDITFQQAQQTSREMNKPKDDPCYLQLHQSENNKKLKFVTTNYIDLLEAKDKLNFFGVSVKEQLFVPSEKINVYSNLLNGSTGGILTNEKVKNGFGALPIPTLPSRHQLYHGDIAIEDSFKNLTEQNKNSCNPRDVSFHNRHFYLFDDKQGIDTPDATKSVETDMFGPRGGISTRKMARQRKN